MKGPVLLLAAGVILLVAVTGNMYFNQDSVTPTVVEKPASPPASTKQKPVPGSLKYVPEDTFLFAGGVESYSVDDLVAMLKSQESISDTSIEELQKEIINNEGMPTGMKMLMSTLFEFSSSMKNPENFTTRLGLIDEIDSAIYTVGMLPVVRLKIENTDNFNTFIQDIEKKTNIQVIEKNFKGISYRSYPFDTPDTQNPSEMSLIIAVHDNYAIFSIEASFEREHYLSLILGIDKPEKALSDSSRLENISKKHNLHPAYLGFIDHVILTKAITNSSQNSFGRMFNYLVDKNTLDKDKTFATVRTASCQKELVAIAQNWPRTIMGYTKISLDTTPMRMDSRILLESNNKDMLEQLQSLRGFIPAVLSDEKYRALLSLALGLNVDALLPFITKMTADLTTIPYSCEPLKEMQMAIADNQQSPAVAMASMVLSGVKGLSLSLLDIDFVVSDEGSKPDIKSVDALVTISANDPSALLSKALAMAPAPFNTLQVPADGQAVDFPIPMSLPFELQPKIAIKGKNIVVYAGGNGETAALQLATENLSDNGLFALNIGYEKYSKVFNSALGMLGNLDEEQTEIFQSMGHFNADMSFLIDVNEHGPVMDAKITIH
ncbi:hypothetical protein MNBD_GAMMA16-91 [hydrothermal vent metagenome]|uniref:Uncharacterized protein n=1 Tax=hydrothermal vent metagenome TaxID=652676 RepID=A0A3B0ZWC2_9ZZZZ